MERLIQQGDISITLNDLSTPDPSQPSPAPSFFSFFSQVQQQLPDSNKRTKETYRATYLKFLLFCNNSDIAFPELTPHLMESFQSWLRSESLSLNTISFYMRILRAVYNRAVEQQLTVDRRPFRNVYTGMAKTAKRALTLEQIRQIARLKTDSPNLQKARDMFMFSFYTRGMAFVDMAYLQRQDLRDGMLVYKRHKTGQLLTLRWERHMQEIVDRYSISGSPYLLPFIHKQNGKERNQYRHLQWCLNRDLKTIGSMLGLRQLTLYCARHSWASIARQMSVPIEVISQGMGHTSERTTAIYLRTADEKAIDRANLMIHDALVGLAEKSH